jgi:hypothetical protein
VIISKIETFPLRIPLTRVSSSDASAWGDKDLPAADSLLLDEGAGANVRLPRTGKMLLRWPWQEVRRRIGLPEESRRTHRGNHRFEHRAVSTRRLADLRAAEREFDCAGSRRKVLVACKDLPSCVASPLG